MKTKENKIFLFSTSHLQGMSCHFPGSRVSACLVVALEDKHNHKKCPAHTSVSPTCILLSRCCWTDGIWCGISPLVSWGQLCLLCRLSSLCPPSAYWWEGVLEREHRCCAGACLPWPCDLQDLKEMKNTVVVLYREGSKWGEFFRLYFTAATETVSDSVSKVKGPNCLTQ